MGPSVDLSLEIVNKAKTFSFVIGVPLEILFPIQYFQQPMKFNYIYTKIKDGSVYLYNELINNFHVNISVGISLTFNFYLFEKIDLNKKSS